MSLFHVTFWAWIPVVAIVLIAETRPTVSFTPGRPPQGFVWNHHKLQTTTVLLNSKEEGTPLPPPPPSQTSSSSSSDSKSSSGSSSSSSSDGSRPKNSLYRGRPSRPGWKRRQLDTLADWAMTEESNRPVICNYEPDPIWLWTKWRGTVLSITYLPILANMIVGIMVDYGVHSFSASSWPLLARPPVDDPIIQQLQGLNTLWEYQVTLCTFILTFFTAEAYKHWRSVYFTTRAIQGRINDVCMLVTIGAGGRIKDQVAAANLVDNVTRLIKLSHTFFWAATPTCSNGVGDGEAIGDDGDDLPPDEWRENAIGPLLLSSQGLSRLVTIGELTLEEARVLVQSELPPSQYSYILLEWVGLYIMEGLESGLLGHHGTSTVDTSSSSSSGLEENLLRQLTAVRAEYFNIGDYAAGRMPLAYVQLVQVLVDCLLILAPFSLYSEVGSLSIILVGLLTFFFKGLLELSKSFLDPFGNEGYPGQNIRVDVLVSELNYGASTRWVQAAAAFPLLPDPPSLDTTARDGQ